MLLSCPNCGVRYEVPDADWPRETTASGELALKPRKVRCKICQEIWVATPEPEPVLELGDPLPPQPPEETVEAGPAEAAEERPSAPRRRHRWWPWIVAILLFLLAAVLIALATNRLQPERYGLPGFRLEMSNLALPTLPGIRLPSVRLPVLRVPEGPASPLRLEHEVVKRSLPDGGAVWEVSGTIHNPTFNRVPVPPVELTLLDQQGEVLVRWTMPAGIPSIAAGGTHMFETSAVNPPDKATDIRLALRPPGPGRR
ncbi:MAG: DUF3426 domain-containing protein [Sphingomonadaceae bacterium]